MDANKLKRDLLKNKSHDIFKNVQALWDLAYAATDNHWFCILMVMVMVMVYGGGGMFNTAAFFVAMLCGGFCFNGYVSYSVGKKFTTDYLLNYVWFGIGNDVQG